MTNYTVILVSRCEPSKEMSRYIVHARRFLVS